MTLPPAVPAAALTNLAAVRAWAQRLPVPLLFLNPTHYNLIGADDWLPSLHHVVGTDAHDGRHPRLQAPRAGRRDGGYGALDIADANNRLLALPAVQSAIAALGAGARTLAMMFDAETEARLAALGAPLLMPTTAQREAVGNKLATVRLGERAGVASVPNVLARADSYASLRRVAGHLGERLVVQAGVGYSGHTTWFIDGPDDWARDGAAIAAEPEVKIMRRIRARGTAIEACATRAGTVVGPLLTELIGHPELTPYPGGWCGNERAAEAFDAATRRAARAMAERIGDQLYAEGYRGLFELDLLIDEDSGALWLGELNARITGATPMTSLARAALEQVPLHLFHLLEWLEQPCALDLAAINDRFECIDTDDSASQMILGWQAPGSGRIGQVPVSGHWRLGTDGRLQPVDAACRPRLDDEALGFLVRTVAVGDHVEPGTVVARLLLRGRVQTPDGRLTARAQAWIKAAGALFVLQAEG